MCYDENCFAYDLERKTVKSPNTYANAHTQRHGNTKREKIKRDSSVSGSPGQKIEYILKSDSDRFLLWSKAILNSVLGIFKHQGRYGTVLFQNDGIHPVSFDVSNNSGYH